MKLFSLFTAKSLENKAVVGNDTCLKKNGNESLSATSGNVYNSGTRAKKLQAQAFENAENGADKVLFKSEKNSSVHKKYMNFSSAWKRALDAPLYAFSGGRSKRPQNRPNTPQVLSDVYNSGTRAKRRPVDGRVSARSFFHRVLQMRRNFSPCVHKKVHKEKNHKQMRHYAEEAWLKCWAFWQL